MRPEETHVMEALAREFGVTYIEGEDPPDAYLIRNGAKIAVEVSRLIEQIVDDGARLHSRYGDDTPALNVIEQLEEEMAPHIPGGKYVFLLLSSPVSDVRAVKSYLSNAILEMLRNSEAEREYELKGTSISVHIYNQDRKNGQKLIGAVDNLNASPSIDVNAFNTLIPRVKDKESKRDTAFNGKYWLALFNEYWIASPQTFQRTLADSQVQHGFDCILLVDGQSKVSILQGEA